MENQVDIPALVRQAKTGNSDAFGKLYDYFLDNIYRFVFFRVSSREDAEDITELIFMNAFTHIKTYEDSGIPFQAWLYRIARNKVIDHYRSQKPHTNLDETFDIPDDESPVEETVSVHMTYELVKQKLTTIPDTYREIIILKYIEEKDNEEISLILGKPVAHIRVLQNRALKKLRQLFNND